MAVTLNATACPQPVAPGAAVYMEDQNSTSGSPATSLSFTSGNLGAISSSKLNRNAAGHDQQTVYGAGGYGVGSGLTLSAGTGLTVVAADGQATVHGLVELRAGTGGTTAVVGTSATSWVWLNQDGTLTVQEGTTAKPAGNCTPIGAALSNATAVTAIETAGVVYWRGGELYRETNDNGAPGDSPDSTLRLYTKTQGGTYYWDGTVHRLIPGSTVRRGSYSGQTGVVSGDVYWPTASPFLHQYNGTSWVDKWAAPVTPPAALTSWTALGATASTATESGGVLHVVAAAAAGDNLVAYGKAVPTATPWTADICLVPVQFNVATCEFGAMLHNTANGKYYAFGYERPGGLMVYRYTDSTTYTSALFWQSYASWGAGAWLRIVNDGTSVAFSVSHEGIHYRPLQSEALSSFITAVTHYGFFVNAGGTTAAEAVSVLSVSVS